MGLYPCQPVSGTYVANLVRSHFPSQYWTTMVAIAYAESTFYPCAISAGGSIGLWQVKPTSANMSESTLLNPQYNAAGAAYVLLHSSSPGLQNWGSYNSGVYRQFLGTAQTYINQTAPVSNPRSQAAPVLTIAPSFGASGSASVTPGGRINGTLRLSVAHGTVSYKVTMWVTPTYNTTYPTSTTTTGSTTNTTVAVNQSLIAPLPSPEIIRSYQQIHSGSIPFHYTVNWTVTDQTGASKTVSAGQVVTLTVQ